MYWRRHEKGNWQALRNGDGCRSQENAWDTLKCLLLQQTAFVRTWTRYCRRNIAVAVASRGSVVRPNFDQATRCKGLIDMPNEHWKLAEKLVPTLRKLELATVLLRLAHSPKQHLMLFYTCYHWLVYLSNWMPWYLKAQMRVQLSKHFRDTLVQSLTERFFLDDLNVAGEETDICKVSRSICWLHSWTPGSVVYHSSLTSSGIKTLFALCLRNRKSHAIECKAAKQRR